MTAQDILSFVALGFIVKLVASIDDSVAKVPVIAAITRTPKGKIAFAVGNLVALAASLVLVSAMAIRFGSSPTFRYAAGILILGTAAVTYFRLLPSDRQRRSGRWPLRQEPDVAHFFRLAASGFAVSAVTLVDDTAVMAPLLVHDDGRNAYLMAGILLAGILHLALILSVSHALEKLPRKREIAAAGLAVYGTLVFFGLL